MLYVYLQLYYRGPTSAFEREHSPRPSQTSCLQTGHTLAKHGKLVRKPASDGMKNEYRRIGIPVYFFQPFINARDVEFMIAWKNS